MAPSALSPRQRRDASLALAAARGVKPPDGLPLIESEEEAGHRTDDELRSQVLANALYWLRAVFARRGLPRAEYLRAFESVRDAAEGALADSHLVFIDDPAPSAEAVTNAEWAIEGIHALLWAAGLVKELPWPDRPCDPGPLEPLVERVLDGQPLRRRATAEVLDQADLHYALLGAVVRDQAQGVDGSVVYERARALCWLVQPDVGWDEVDLTT